MKELNNLTHPKLKKGQPTVQIHRKGTIIFSKQSGHKIGLTNDDKIVFMADENGYYVTKTYGTEGFTLRMNTSGSLMFNNATLASEILNKDTMTKKTYMIGNAQEYQGRILYPLLER